MLVSVCLCSSYAPLKPTLIIVTNRDITKKYKTGMYILLKSLVWSVKQLERAETSLVVLITLKMKT